MDIRGFCLGNRLLLQRLLRRQHLWWMVKRRVRKGGRSKSWQWPRCNRGIENRGVIENNDVQIRVEKDQHVITKYLPRCYVGKVLNVDPNDREIDISFMENKQDTFQWPGHGDVFWILSKDVLCIVAEPLLSGRLLQLRTEDKGIYDKFLSWTIEINVTGSIQMWHNFLWITIVLWLFCLCWRFIVVLIH